MKLCTPATVYLVLAVIALIFNMRFSVASMFVHVAFIAVWTLILNWICGKGLVWVSWLLVILPYLFMGLVMLIAIEYLALEDLKKQGYFDGDNSI